MSEMDTPTLGASWKAAFGVTNTYDHRTLKTRLPVRSALFKQRTGGLVVRWVTTSEYPLLYVFDFLHPIVPVGLGQGTAVPEDNA